MAVARRDDDEPPRPARSATFVRGSRPGPAASYQQVLVHLQSWLGSKHFVVGRLGSFLFRFVTIFDGVSQDRDASRFGIELQHRQHPEAIDVVHMDAEDHELWLNALDL